MREIIASVGALSRVLGADVRAERSVQPATTEEAGIPYEAIPVDTRKGEQHKPAYLAINPNAKVPTIVGGDVTVFDSNAILLYLGEKTGKFMPPAGDKVRGELLSWLMFLASGVGPYAGQSVHFRMYAPVKNDYAINRYAFEA
jgi:GST-like protein